MLDQKGMRKLESRLSELKEKEERRRAKRSMMRKDINQQEKGRERNKRVNEESQYQEQKYREREDWRGKYNGGNKEISTDGGAGKRKADGDKSRK